MEKFEFWNLLNPLTQAFARHSIPAHFQIERFYFQSAQSSGPLNFVLPLFRHLRPDA
ncbi:hypothetical protein [Leisingera sp. M523]|uniref:hypothetical protein n=1 Tax=Leisingera sp. M523 TaxID=2867013 RepID=UPI0021A54C51|nr:hypothetical protein [Leisingera sp. M523]UWQ30512.1 hypothetical protein K3557_08305 [Leisingera sp. M523]